jgi:hypothetical protein
VKPCEPEGRMGDDESHATFFSCTRCFSNTVMCFIEVKIFSKHSSLFYFYLKLKTSLWQLVNVNSHQLAAFLYVMRYVAMFVGLFNKPPYICRDKLGAIKDYTKYNKCWTVVLTNSEVKITRFIVSPFRFSWRFKLIDFLDFLNFVGMSIPQVIGLYFFWYY